MGATIICFLGGTGGKVRESVDLYFLVFTDKLDFIEDIHLSLSHFCCKVLSEISRGTIWI